MLDTATKRRIDDCRDILVGKLPDPKAQIEQITIGLIYKFMDDMDKEAIELGGKAKFFADYKMPDPEFPNNRKKDKTIPFSQYAWDKLLHPTVTAAEMLALYTAAIAGMEQNPNIPPLFRNIFKNAYLPYRDPETLKMFLKTIGEFAYTHSEKLGDAFEYLLSVMGSQGDAGQFRTPRHIIDFLVAIVDPDKGDTIMDPACGTAGFLIAAFKHILLKHTKANKQGLNIYTYNQLEDKPFTNLGDKLNPDDRKKLVQNFMGYDISPDMVRLSLVNLYLHGFNTPNIHEYDTLSSEERWNESFDVVLANPPFMSPKGGIRPHKKFSISSNRSEVLFVDYIAEHLNTKGKAGIIVPEGIIFQSGTAYKDLRKMLVQNYLYAVVSLPAGVFNPYSGVKTSILLMDRAVAKKREEILFIKIDNDGYNLGAQRTAVKGGQLETAIQLVHDFAAKGHCEESPIAHLVPKAEIGKTGDYNLSGERYKITIQKSSEFELISLGEIFELSSGNGLIAQNMIPGNFPVYGGNGINGWHSNYFIENPTIVIGRVGAYCGSIHVTKPKSWVTDNGLYITKYLRNDVNQDFLALMLEELKLNRFAKVGGQPSISQSTVKEQQIPLPPLPIQEAIVAEIETYQKIIDGANAVVANYKPQIDIDPDWEMVELGEICDVRDGTHDSPKYLQEGGIPLITQKNITKEGLSFADINYISKQDHEKIIKRSNVVFGDIIFSMIGANRGMSCLIDDNRVFSIKNVGLIKPIGKAEQKYILFYLQSQKAQDYVAQISVGGAQSFVSLGKLRSFPIPLPYLETQRQIVTQIEQEQALVNANKQLIAIFEQKIKDRIAKVWGG